VPVAVLVARIAERRPTSAHERAQFAWFVTPVLRMYTCTPVLFMFISVAYLLAVEGQALLVDAVQVPGETQEVQSGCC
jgi:hypothetical protein